MKPASVKMPCTGKNAYRHHTGSSVRQDKTTASADAAHKHSAGAFFPAPLAAERVFRVLSPVSIAFPGTG